ncbi:M48 family metalloprotease, partial [Pseudomonas aeruginosa]|uniref:M48 family metalloprotease n=1 Tax=Pseudomonas aeruginosa TaxID=287 RepID=UPI003CC6DA08
LFSQSQESDADDYSYELLKKRGVNSQGLVTAFEKLAKLGGGDSSLFDSHPGSQARAYHIRQRIGAYRKKRSHPGLPRSRETASR